MLTILMMIESESDRSFVATLYEKYAKKMKAIALDILKNDYDAEDCVHETVIAIVKRLDSFKDIDDESHLKWLICLVCKNTALNMLKKSRRRQSREISLDALPFGGMTDEVADDSPTPEEIAVGEDCVRHMIAMINKLDEKYREVILLKYSGLDSKSISELLFISQDTVRQRLFRARQMLIKMGGGRFYE